MDKISHSRKGLMNPVGENNCFLNSTIQILWHLDSFRNNFSLLDPHLCTGESSCIFCALKVLFAQYAHTEHVALPPDALRQALALTFSTDGKYQLGLLEDAAECYENVLERLHFHVSGSVREANIEPCKQSHCITHRKLFMSISETTVCRKCEERRPSRQKSSPMMSYTQAVNYVSTSALEQVSGGSVAPNALTRTPLHQSRLSFGRRLNAAMNLGDDGPPCKFCNDQMITRRTLENLPEVLGVGLIWDSDQSSTDQIRHLVNDIELHINPNELFDSVTSNPGPNVRYELTGLVCYYGKHYSTFLNQQTQQPHHQRQLRYQSGAQEGLWISCDDSCVTVLGSTWEVVVDKICRGHYQPLLLLYTLKGLGLCPIRVESAPQRNVFINQSQQSYSLRPTTARRPMTSRSPRSSLSSENNPSGSRYYSEELQFNNSENFRVDGNAEVFGYGTTLPRVGKTWQSQHINPDSNQSRRYSENSGSCINLSCAENVPHMSDNVRYSLPQSKSQNFVNSVSQTNDISHVNSGVKQRGTGSLSNYDNGVNNSNQQVLRNRQQCNSLSAWITGDNHGPPGGESSSYIDPSLVEKILSRQAVRPNSRLGSDSCNKSDSSGSLTGSMYSIDKISTGSCSSLVHRTVCKSTSSDSILHSGQPGASGVDVRKQISDSGVGLSSSINQGNSGLIKKKPPLPPPVRRTSTLSTPPAGCEAGMNSGVNQTMITPENTNSTDLMKSNSILTKNNSPIEENRNKAQSSQQKINSQNVANVLRNKESFENSSRNSRFDQGSSFPESTSPKGKAGDRSSSSSTSSSIGSCSLSSNQDSGYRGSDAGGSTCSSSSVDMSERLFVDFPGVGRIPIAAGYGNAVERYSGELRDWKITEERGEGGGRELKGKSNQIPSYADATCYQLLKDVDQLIESSRAAAEASRAAAEHVTEAIQLCHKAMSLLKKAEGIHGISDEMTVAVQSRQEYLTQFQTQLLQNQAQAISECKEAVRSKEEIGEMLAHIGRNGPVKELNRRQSENSRASLYQSNKESLDKVQNISNKIQLDNTLSNSVFQSQDEVDCGKKNNYGNSLGKKLSYEEMLKKQVQAFVKKGVHDTAGVNTADSKITPTTNYNNANVIKQLKTSVNGLSENFENITLSQLNTSSSSEGHSYSISAAERLRKMNYQDDSTCNSISYESVKSVNKNENSSNEQFSVNRNSSYKPNENVPVVRTRKKSVRFADEIDVESLQSEQLNEQRNDQNNCVNKNINQKENIVKAIESFSVKSCEDSNSLNQGENYAINKSSNIDSNFINRSQSFSNMQTSNSFSKTSSIELGSKAAKLNLPDQSNNCNKKLLDSDFANDDDDCVGSTYSDDNDSEATLIDETDSLAVRCNLCHKKRVSQSETYCSGCSFYMSRFQNVDNV